MRNINGLAKDESCRFRPPKNAQEEGSFLVKKKGKSTRYKDMWVVDVFRTFQAAPEQIFCILDPESVFKDDDFHRVQSRREVGGLGWSFPKLFPRKFVQELANKKGGRCPPRSLYGIVCGLRRHLKDVNEGNALKQCARNV